MPGLNGTGPMGIGSMTRGARGLCNAGREFYGRAGNRPGLGYGPGTGRCRSHRNRFMEFFRTKTFSPYAKSGYPVSFSKEGEIEFLNKRVADIKTELDEINTRISSLQQDKTATA